MYHLYILLYNHNIFISLKKLNIMTYFFLAFKKCFKNFQKNWKISKVSSLFTLHPDSLTTFYQTGFVSLWLRMSIITIIKSLLFLLSHLGVSCKNLLLHYYQLEHLSSENKDIFLHNHNNITTRKTLNIHTILLSHTQLTCKFPQWSH